VTGRGEQRRAALVQAATTLLGGAGPTAVTARAVAAQARVPLAAVSYYFDGVDDLLGEAAERLFEAYLGEATALVRDAGGRPWEETLVRVWLDPSVDGPEPGRVRSTVQQLLAAAGMASLRPALQRWDDALVRLVEEVLRQAGRDTSRTRVLLAALDGLSLARLGGIDVSRGRQLDDGDLRASLVADVRLVLDDLAPNVRVERSGVARATDVAQKSLAVGSSRPDSPT